MLLFFTGNIIAQQLKDTIAIQEVKIIGKRKLEEAGLTITHIDTLAMQMMKTQNLTELLSSYSPVFMKSYGRGSTATASFRGTAPSHTQLYWNGIKLNSPMRGDVDFSLFPIYFIDDISLLQGGSSLQAGSGALGGSILINNKPDWTDQLSIRYIQTVESFSTAKEYLNVGFGNGRIQFKTRLFSDRSTNDFPYFNYGVLPMHETVQKNADYSKMGLLQEVYSRMGKQTLSAKIWVYQSNRDLPQLMSFEGDARKETQNDQNLRAVFNWKYLTEKSKLEWVGGVNLNNLNYFRSSTEANFVNFDSHSKEQSYTSQFSYDWNPKENLCFNGSFNSTYNTVSVYDRAQKLGYDKDLIELSLMYAAHYQPLPKVSLSLLCRSDLYNNRLIGLIPSLGAEYFTDIKQESSVKLNLSRNYHQPGLNDLYWLPGGNPNLKPEDGFSGDLSYICIKKHEQITFSGQITGFASLINNWIVWQPSASGAYFWEASNLRKVFARGAEIQTSLHTMIANGISFDLRGNYSYSATSNIDAVPSVDESRGKQLIYIPKHKANLFAELDFSEYYLKLNAPFTGKRYTTSNNVESDYEKVLNPYWILNMNCGRKFALRPFLMDISAGVENLTNQDYMAILWRAMPGRYYSITIQLSYKK
jgi:iron complex outermembrane receptor protein